MKAEGKHYLGDGVYVSTDGYHIVLTTEDGVQTTNTIYLDAQVYLGLVRFVAAQQEAQEETVR